MFRAVPETIKVSEIKKPKEKLQEVKIKSQKPEKKSQEVKKEVKKPGRPKVNRETKKRYTFTLLPSIYYQAVDIAYANGKSISELVEELLQQYIGMN